jgi:cytochrome c biogenesis protein CcdA
MLDPVVQGLTAVSSRSAYAAPLVFLAGAASSVGPCVAPRFIAIAGMTAGKSRLQTAVLVAAFVCGLTATYAAFGAVSPLLARATEWSTFTYVIVAIVLGAGGVVTLWRGGPACVHVSH